MSERFLWTIVSLAVLLSLFGVWISIKALLAAVRRGDGQNAELLELEHAVAAILSEAGDSQELAPRIIEVMAAYLRFDYGEWWLIDRDRGELYCAATWCGAGVEVSEFERNSRSLKFKAGVGLPGRVWSSGQPAWIEDVVKDANFPRAPFAERAGLHGAVGLPIKVDGEMLGTYNFFGRQVHEPDYRVLQALTSLGTQIGNRVKRIQADARAAQAQKMGAIGRLAGGVAHDFNNNLSCILGLCELLSKQLPPGSAAGGDVAEIKAVAERSAALTQQLLSFSRKKEGARKIYDANELILADQKILARMMGAQFRITASLWPSALPFLADPVRFSQVLMNLAVNARDAMPQGGDISISSSKSSSFVEIAFKDGGCGMETSVLARLSEPFFTTKEQGKGTGLGLSIVYSVVTDWNGCVQVESEPGRGTIFRLRFPWADGPIEVLSRSSDVQKEELREGGLILLVEDEASLLNVTSRQLQGGGYRVLAASSAEEALALFVRRSDEIGLVITDVNMPKTNGVALAQKLRAMRAQTKVLFISGYGLDVLAPSDRPEGAEFLAKPFSSDSLTAKVGEMLAAGAS